MNSHAGWARINARIRGGHHASLMKRIMSDLEKPVPEPRNEAERIVRLQRYDMAFAIVARALLESFVENEDWFAGILLSASILDDLGKRKLNRVFQKMIDSRKIERLTFEETIMFLLSSSLINAKTYTQLMQIKKARNRLAHDSLSALKLCFQPDKSEAREIQQAKSTIKKAMCCLNEIACSTTKRKNA